MRLVIVGQRTRLEASFGSSPASNVVWTLVGETAQAVVKTYDTSEEKGTFTLLDEQDLKKPELEFNWIRTGRYTIHCHCDNGDSTEDFTVVGPTEVAITSTTSRVGIGDVVVGWEGQQPIAAKHLQFGDETARVAGIVWTCTCKAPADSAGRLRCTQLISINRTRNRSGGGALRFASDGYVLDEVVCYDIENPEDADDPMELVIITAGESKSFQCQDSPGTPLPPGLREDTYESHELDEKFQSYLMFKPTLVDSIWVTLARLDWWYKGKAIFNESDATWRTNDCDNSANPSGVVSWELPVWTRNKNDIEWA